MRLSCRVASTQEKKHVVLCRQRTRRTLSSFRESRDHPLDTDRRHPSATRAAGLRQATPIACPDTAQAQDPLSYPLWICSQRPDAGCECRGNGDQRRAAAVGHRKRGEHVWRGVRRAYRRDRHAHGFGLVTPFKMDEGTQISLVVDLEDSDMRGQ